jgi:hypothetical protein
MKRVTRLFNNSTAPQSSLEEKSDSPIRRIILDTMPPGAIDELKIKNHEESARMFKQVIKYQAVTRHLQGLKDRISQESTDELEDQAYELEQRKGRCFDRIHNLFAYLPGYLKRKANAHKRLYVEVAISNEQSTVHTCLGVASPLGMAELHELEDLTHLFKNPAYRQDKEACCVIS